MTPPSKTDTNHTSHPSTEEPLTFEKVWAMFKETDKKFQETDKSLKELTQSLKELREQSERETIEIRKGQDRVDAQIEKTSKEISRVEGQLFSLWGKLVESLVEGDLIRLFQERGISVYHTIQRLKGFSGDTNYEFDIIAQNGDEMVVVEVKTTLRSSDVKEFAHKMEKFREWLPRYAENTIYGAMAYIHADSNVVRQAEKNGFFVIRATGDSASILNQDGFEPKKF